MACNFSSKLWEKGKLPWVHDTIDYPGSCEDTRASNTWPPSAEFLTTAVFTCDGKYPAVGIWNIYKESHMFSTAAIWLWTFHIKGRWYNK